MITLYKSKAQEEALKTYLFTEGYAYNLKGIYYVNKYV